ncbi:ribosome biogenesis protein SLX9-domain-containing protein [Morchella snyderi]|nr:ribosome biogenesis protein SLX9-domain-containing protein [Morchella snyderi]
MAPTKPSKRPSLRTRPSRPPTSTTTTTTTTPTPRTKKAKQHTRRTTFLSRITKPTPTPTTTRTRTRRRRAPPTQLALDSLASALDDAIATQQPKPAGGGGGVGSKTIRSRPDAMKRKERVVRNECERFGKNLAIMAAGVAATAAAVGGEGGAAVRRPSTWEALRGFIEGTMERKEEFVKKAEEGEGEEMVL